MSAVVLKLWGNEELPCNYEVVQDDQGYAIWRDAGPLTGRHTHRNIETIAEAVKLLAELVEDDQ